MSESLPSNRTRGFSPQNQERHIYNYAKKKDNAHLIEICKDLISGTSALGSFDDTAYLSGGREEGSGNRAEEQFQTTVQCPQESHWSVPDKHFLLKSNTLSHC